MAFKVYVFSRVGNLLAKQVSLIIFGCVFHVMHLLSGCWAEKNQQLFTLMGCILTMLF